MSPDLPVNMRTHTCGRQGPAGIQAPLTQTEVSIIHLYIRRFALAADVHVRYAPVNTPKATKEIHQ